MRYDFLTYLEIHPASKHDEDCRSDDDAIPPKCFKSMSRDKVDKEFYGEKRNDKRNDISNNERIKVVGDELCATNFDELVNFIDGGS